MISNLLHVLFHIGKVVVADGKKRFLYSLLHVLLVAAAIGLGLFIYWGFKNVGSYFGSNFWYGIGICIAMGFAFAIGLYLLIEGVLAQLVTAVTALIGVFVPKNHLYNLLAMFVSSASLALGAFAVYALYPYIL